MLASSSWSGQAPILGTDRKEPKCGLHTSRYGRAVRADPPLGASSGDTGVTISVVWVHGIGDHKAGYSEPWRVAFDRYLHLPIGDYAEVLWETVFDDAPGTRSGTAGSAPALTAQERAEEEAVREELRAIMLARAAASQAGSSATRGEGGVVSWSDAQGTRGLGDWLLQANEYLGDFAKYLVSRPIRTAVKERFKEQLRPILSQRARIGVISHSWGTVVSYDSLIDLAIESPGIGVASLITLGSPLWMVRRFLDDKSGAKPANVGTWVNIHARLDLVGSWLNPAYRVDKEYEVPNFGQPAHGSYFWEGNEAVQKDLVAQYVLGRPVGP